MSKTKLGREPRQFKKYVPACGLCLGLEITDLRKHSKDQWRHSREYVRGSVAAKTLEQIERFVCDISWLRPGDFKSFDRVNNYVRTNKTVLGKFIGLSDRDGGYAPAKSWRMRKAATSARFVLVMDSDILRDGIYRKTELVAKLRRIFTGENTREGHACKRGVYVNKPDIKRVMSRVASIMRNPGYIDRI